MEFITRSPDETRALGGRLADALQGGEVIAFTGSMGMGKTAFTRGLVLALGGGDVVSSPTFAIVNEYRGGGRLLCHFDMYRIEGFDDLYSTGFFDYLDGGAVLAIEWSENIEDSGALPEETIWIEIRRLGDNSREFLIEGDERFENLGD